ncbi:MAG: VCBS repeat-containing protein [Planctomycetota bacterium]|nr:MAG: VCBS repeat-containing protein [Planctomycetota bacterium]
MQPPRSPLSWLRPLLVGWACFLASARLAAQQYSDERIPLGGDDSTASGSQLEHGDIDGDGRQDLVVREPGNVDWVLRNAPTGFAQVDLEEASDSNGFAVVDLNNDGRADLLTQKFVQLGWYRGQADATFGSFQPIQNEGSQEGYWSKGAADVNGDGKVDVVVGMSTNSSGSTGVLRWFAGNGSGAFAFAQSVASTPYPVVTELGDFDADGFVDAAAGGWTGVPTFWFRATGTGFAAPATIAAGAAEGYRFATGDFDADGIDDLVCQTNGASASWIRGGAGGPTLGGTLSLPGALGARGVDAADLDGDGADDALFVASIFGSGAIWRALGSAGSGLGAPVPVVDLQCGAATAFEYDGHPGLDLAYTRLSITWPTLRPGDGQGGFLPPFVLATGGACGDADGASLGDLDGDGAVDLAFEAGTWLRGNGDGSFAQAAALGAAAGQLVDLDGDGRLDAVALPLGCAVPELLTYALGNGAGFGAAVAPPQPPAGLLRDYAIADIDGDGDLDFASAGFSGAYTHRNDGSAVFAPYTTTALPGPCSNIGAGDLNGDGRADLARTNRIEFSPWGPFESYLHWGLSDGAGNVVGVQSKKIFTDAQGELAIDDFDLDGRNDVAWTQQFAVVFVAHGDGAGNLGTPTTLPGSSFGGPKTALARADIDADGLPDVLASGAFDPTVSVLRRSGVTYALWRQIDATVGAGRILPADFDADGQIDLAWSSGTSAQFALNLRADPSGTAPFGTGTSGCLGRASIGAAQVPQLGNANFRVLAHQLPPSAPGWFAIGTAGSPAGIDPFALGALLHVDPLASAFVALYPAPADASGQADRVFAVPNAPALIGVSLFAQALHLGGAALGHDCVNTYLSMVGSRGLAVVLQP